MDSAFAHAAYPGYTTDDLRHMLRTRPGCAPGERLRHVRAQRAA